MSVISTSGSVCLFAFEGQLECEQLNVKGVVHLNVSSHDLFLGPGWLNHRKYAARRAEIARMATQRLCLDKLATDCNLCTLAYNRS